MQVLAAWFRRYFSHPQAVLLAILLLVGVTTILTLGTMLAPVIAAIVIAFLLEGPTAALEARGVSRMPAISLVFLGFLTLLLFLFFVMIPLLSLQLTQFLQDAPRWMQQGQQLLLQLPERYPEIISADQINSVITATREGINQIAQAVLSYSLASITALITFLVYIVLVPMMVFFFLKDKLLIFDWLKGFLPADHGIARGVWQEINWQAGNYVRGKFYEILIVGVVSYAAFAVFRLNYASLLAALIGLSVIVPYIGAAIVTVPVILVAYFQWGWGSDFLWLTAIYFIIQALDGNILVPLLFSEAVNLHPLAIIIAVLVFGGLWGFWGVFFAIPLATLVKALLTSWPRAPIQEEDTVSG